MRDPMSWAIPLFRAFGIPVKVHLFFFIITLGFFIRQLTFEGNIVWWGDILLFTVFLLFGIILLHEFGHCFGGRWVGGEANEILIWPLADWHTSMFRTTGRLIRLLPRLGRQSTWFCVSFAPSSWRCLATCPP